jgi:hypothetical protein
MQVQVLSCSYSNARTVTPYEMFMILNLLLFMEYPANVNSSNLTQSDHNNFNIRNAATFYNNMSTTVKHSLL